MDNINREVRNRTEIDNNIPGMDMEPEGNEYKNIGRKKDENDIVIKRLIQHNIQEQKRENKITSSADRQIKFPQILEKRTVSILNGTRQSENTSIENQILRRYDDSEQGNNQRTEMEDKENWRQPT
ncbi:MAG: hypothetical protein EZS28_034215 [Streblomastix strix]|uniref:Uncharacterized protein n=1 Tax=Streblomastix strix TaxID=222440 RepID=A0A5J4UJR6_9EUKA|nr:MAG: hypothetical protein EZS28_034215 [Streblomastix strix]